MQHRCPHLEPVERWATAPDRSPRPHPLSLTPDAIQSTETCGRSVDGMCKSPEIIHRKCCFHWIFVLFRRNERRSLRAVGTGPRARNHTDQEAFGWTDPNAETGLRVLIRGVPEAFGWMGPKREIRPSGRGSRGPGSLRAERAEARNRAFGPGAARIGKPPGGAVRNVGNGLRAWNHADQETRGRKGPKTWETTFGPGTTWVGKPSGGSAQSGRSGLRAGALVGRKAFGRNGPNAGTGLRVSIRRDQEAFGWTGPKRGEAPSGKEPRGSASLRVDGSRRRQACSSEYEQGLRVQAPDVFFAFGLDYGREF